MIRWLKSVYSNLTTQPKQFWNYISKFKNNYHTVTQIKSGDSFIAEPQLFAEAFADYFRSIFNSSSATQVHYSPLETTSSDFLNVPFVFDADVRRAIRRLKSTKSVGPDDIPSFIIKGCSEILVPVPKHIFNIGLSNGGFPSLWKETTVAPVFKKYIRALVTNYTPISLLNNFSKIFKIIIHDQLSYYFKSKLHLSQHGFIKSKSTVINLTTHLNKFTPVVCRKGRWTLFALILVKPLIKFPIVCCHINLTILASHQDTSPGSKVTYLPEIFPFVY
jgi:hypothetical protein